MLNCFISVLHLLLMSTVFLFCCAFCLFVHVCVCMFVINVLFLLVSYHNWSSVSFSGRGWPLRKLLPTRGWTWVFVTAFVHWFEPHSVPHSACLAHQFSATQTPPGINTVEPRYKRPGKNSTKHVLERGMYLHGEKKKSRVYNQHTKRVNYWSEDVAWTQQRRPELTTLALACKEHELHLSQRV